MKIVAEAKGINFSYYKQNRVLTDINFVIYENDFIGLIGPNGGGKTTLLKIMLGLLKPNKGNLKIFNTNSKKARNKIGYVPQYNKIDLNYPINAFEVVMSGFLGNKKIGSRFTKMEKDKAEKVLKDLRLFDLKDRSIRELSGGQRQRIMIARALVREPDLLLLDEPTNNVDEESGEDLYNILHKLNKRMAIVIVSHDTDIISSHVKRIICLNNKMVCNDTVNITNISKNKAIKKIHHNIDCIIH